MTLGQPLLSRQPACCNGAARQTGQPGLDHTLEQLLLGADAGRMRVSWRTRHPAPACGCAADAAWRGASALLAAPARPARPDGPGNTCSAAQGARKSAKIGNGEVGFMPPPPMLGIGRRPARGRRFSSLNARRSQCCRRRDNRQSTSTSWRSAAWVTAATICANAASPHQGGIQRKCRRHAPGNMTC